MPKIKEITHYLESIAPLSYQESYDNSGLITGNPEDDVKGITVSLDCTEDVVIDAINNGCNLIISHHPIIFSGLKKITGRNYVERTIIRAIKNDISIYAIHTNLDNVSNGVNRIIGEKLKLKNLKVLSTKKGMLLKLVTFCPVDFAEKVRSALFEAGAGKISNYSECSFNSAGEGTFSGNDAANPFAGKKNERHTEKEIRIETILPAYLKSKVLKALFDTHPYEEVAYDLYPLENNYDSVGSGMIGELTENQSEETFLKSLKSLMNVSCIRHTEMTERSIKKVAICGGSGSFLLPEAIKAGAQVFITADFKYHQFFDADKQIMIADIGHYESEQYTMELIQKLIMEKFSTFAVRLTKVNTNPVLYI